MPGPAQSLARISLTDGRQIQKKRIRHGGPAPPSDPSNPRIEGAVWADGVAGQSWVTGACLERLAQR